MALDALATSSDLTARGITSDADDNTALAVASAAIRNAADNCISQLTSTVTVEAPRGRLLRLPGPVTDVSSVTVNGDAWTEGVDYLVTTEGLYCIGYSWSQGFQPPYGLTTELPVPVVVTFTHGLADVPPDIVDLCCALVASWKQAKAGGFEADSGVASFRVDDYQEVATGEAAGQASPVWIPETTRADLRSRFGSGASSAEMG